MSDFKPGARILYNEMTGQKWIFPGHFIIRRQSAESATYVYPGDLFRMEDKYPVFIRAEVETPEAVFAKFQDSPFKSQNLKGGNNSGKKGDHQSQDQKL